MYITLLANFVGPELCVIRSSHILDIRHFDWLKNLGKAIELYRRLSCSPDLDGTAMVLVFIVAHNMLWHVWKWASRRMAV